MIRSSVRFPLLFLLSTAHLPFEAGEDGFNNSIPYQMSDGLQGVCPWTLQRVGRPFPKSLGTWPPYDRLLATVPADFKPQTSYGSFLFFAFPAQTVS
jgi:hypothetical protein